MAVKSSTKKRLIELGIAENHAIALATDANLDAIRRMTRDEVAKRTELVDDETELDRVMGIIEEQSKSRRRSSSSSVTLTRAAALLEDIPEGNDRFNVLNHILVPHHELVEIDDEFEALAPWSMVRVDQEGKERLAKELLPKILITDPAVQAIKESTELEVDDLPAGWLANRVLRIVRHSPSAGSSTAYRLIVESA